MFGTPPPRRSPAPGTWAAGTAPPATANVRTAQAGPTTCVPCQQPLHPFLGPCTAVTSSCRHVSACCCHPRKFPPLSQHHHCSEGSATHQPLRPTYLQATWSRRCWAGSRRTSTGRCQTRGRTRSCCRRCSRGRGASARCWGQTCCIASRPCPCAGRRRLCNAWTAGGGRWLARWSTGAGRPRWPRGGSAANVRRNAPGGRMHCVCCISCTRPAVVCGEGRTLSGAAACSLPAAICAVTWSQPVNNIVRGSSVCQKPINTFYIDDSGRQHHDGWGFGLEVRSR